MFAPTNEAFAALPAGVLAKLVKPENKDALTKILTYHLISGNVPSTEVKAGTVKTLEGDTITLTTADGVGVNDAKVVKADITADNGVVHEINAVLSAGIRPRHPAVGPLCPWPLRSSQTPRARSSRRGLRCPSRSTAAIPLGRAAAAST